MDPDFTRTLDLLQSAQDGDAEALDRLFTRYYERVRRIVRLRLGRRLRSRMESGDIMQETFLSAMRSFDRFEVRDEAAFIHWLSRIAEHQIRDAADYHGAQKRSLSREVPLEFDRGSERIGIDPVASGMLPAEALSESEQVALVERCLERLPEEYRELILLRDYEGFSWDEIATETGRPSPDAARMKHATAMVELAKRVRAARHEA